MRQKKTQKTLSPTKNKGDSTAELFQILYPVFHYATIPILNLLPKDLIESIEVEQGKDLTKIHIHFSSDASKVLKKINPFPVTEIRINTKNTITATIIPSQTQLTFERNDLSAIIDTTKITGLGRAVTKVLIFPHCTGLHLKNHLFRGKGKSSYRRRSRLSIRSYPDRGQNI